ncbi:MAG TPA: sugar ABC transporter permease [Anaerolineaceae bacterium]|nr:sugar ABC transporter permease [Anaerolineaceae bacterium]HOR84503.1 sugar ABC transporter permease [Anaerolineaceae bacterium]HPL43088.1 sugar ABC transporter permease [Anaerolineaceae bacterium]HPY33555.1 sugar ABC transporter permease [Anaerolineaceae bacterium]HQC20550.1 sugar ABC transporter permease [Anaerolineaceae bacterium]
MTENTAPYPSHRKTLKLIKLQEQLTGYLFILPALIIILIFGIFPIGYSIYMSLFNWQVTKGPFIGDKNYLLIFGSWWNLLVLVAGLGLMFLGSMVWGKAFQTLSRGRRLANIAGALVLVLGGVIFVTGWGMMFRTGNKDFLNSLIVTVYYALGTVPAEIILGLVLAYILYQDIVGKEVFRMIYFLPYITPSISTAVVFQIIFSSRETSLANRLIGLFGIDPLKWRFEPKPVLKLLGFKVNGLAGGPSLALLTIIIFGIWSFVGYNTVIFLSGLGNIPKEIYEAAEIDGGSKWDRFWHITIPMISPVTFYLTLIGFIGTFKAFNHIYVMRTPSAQNTVITTSLLVFDRFYKANQYGVATAQAIVLFAVILGLTLAQNKIMGERVFYG